MKPLRSGHLMLKFERVCLSRYLGYPSGTYLNPSLMEMFHGFGLPIWGLPLSLEGVGAVLGT